MMPEYRTESLGNLLTEEELRKVKKFIDEDDDKGLRAFLNEPSRRIRLEDKGVVSDYLYYNLLHQKNKIKKMRRL